MNHRDAMSAEEIRKLNELAHRGSSLPKAKLPRAKSGARPSVLLIVVVVVLAMPIFWRVAREYYSPVELPFGNPAPAPARVPAPAAAPVMAKPESIVWEYESFSMMFLMDLEHNYIVNGYQILGVDRLASAMGEDGWELVGQVPDVVSPKMLFKRKKGTGPRTRIEFR